MIATYRHCDMSPSVVYFAVQPNESAPISCMTPNDADPKPLTSNRRLQQ